MTLINYFVRKNLIKMKIEYSIFFLKFSKCTESNACVIYKLGTFLVTCPVFIFL